MKYQIGWIDATMTEWSKFLSWARVGTNYTLDEAYSAEELEDPNVWKDFEAVHEFEADSDSEAIKYAREYDFEGRDIEVFSLVKGDTVIFTEEDL